MYVFMKNMHMHMYVYMHAYFSYMFHNFWGGQWRKTGNSAERRGLEPGPTAVRTVAPVYVVSA